MSHPCVSVCVYCGSRPGSRPSFVSAAARIGESIGRRGWQLVYGIIILIGGGLFLASNQNTKNSYPNNVAGILYNNTVVNSNNIILSSEVFKDSKLIFIDAKLESKQQQLVYNGRVIPLSIYREGAYLPLIVYYTPKGNVFSGLRVCEPCSSFSFHIVEGKYLECDRCGTRWDVETLSGIRGACQQYPPPKIPNTTIDNMKINLSSLGLQFI